MRVLMYIRFVVRRQDAHSRSWQGIFVVAYRLRQEADLAPYESKTLGAALTWFERNLEIPSCLSRRGNARAICWFRDTAQRPLAEIRELAWVLAGHGEPIEQIRTARPGTVLYEDDWQIVAKPRKVDRLRIG